MIVHIVVSVMRKYVKNLRKYTFTLLKVISTLKLNNSELCTYRFLRNLHENIFKEFIALVIRIEGLNFLSSIYHAIRVDSRNA